MDGFSFTAATSPEEAVRHWHAAPDSAYIAGGTDLLPNLKHRIVRPRQLIGLAGALPTGWHQEGDWLAIGAGTKLADLATCSALPAIARAASLVAGPQLRNMGTIGGNVMLDTRCLFLNQSHTWRASLGHCLKADGTWCHVVGGPKTCVATQSSDTVPALIAHGAQLRFLGKDGPHDVELAELFRFDGMKNHTITAGDLLTHIRVPLPPEGHRATYEKVRTRGAIDFPQLGVAIAGVFSGTGEACVATTLSIVIGAVNPQPREVKGIEAFIGVPLTDACIRDIGELVHKRIRPQASVHGDPAWRRLMARVVTERALRDLRDATGR